LRVVEHIHGHGGWLTAVALVHPAIVLRRNRGGAWAVGLSTTLVTAVASLGVWLYPFYTEQLKQRIFQTGPRIGWLFERKEHLAFGAVMFTWAGAAAYVAAWKTEGTDQTFRTLAHRAYVIAAGIAIATAVLGTVVGTFKTF
jgi:hypothetical protein